MNKEIKIGLLAIVAIIALVFGINYLKGINILHNNRNFYAVYENIRDLKVGAPVMVNGYKVGMVTDIALLIENNQNVITIESHNMDSFVEQIINLFDNEQLRQLLVDNALKAVEKYNWNKIGNLYLDVYQSILD